MTKQPFYVLAGMLGFVAAIEIGSSGAATPRPRLGTAKVVEGSTALFLPTFIPGCELTPPKVTSVYKGKRQPVARPRDADIEVFLAGDLPERRYVVVGELQVLARNRNTSLHNMLEYAAREARKLGGDAIVDVWPRPASVDPQGERILTAKVVNWV